jgi:hypothetical protein
MEFVIHQVIKKLTLIIGNFGGFSNPEQYSLTDASLLLGLFNMPAKHNYDFLLLKVSPVSYYSSSTDEDYFDD